MTIVKAVNTHGSIWELRLDNDVDGVLLVCDRIESYSKPTYPPDSGSAEVIAVGEDTIAVDSGSTGWIGTAGHWISRLSHCKCFCHRLPR